MHETSVYNVRNFEYKNIFINPNIAVNTIFTNIKGYFSFNIFYSNIILNKRFDKEG